MSTVLRLPMTTLTTRNSVALYPWQTTTPLPCTGPVLGLDRLAGNAPFACDPWQLYTAGVITSPNAFVLGQVGSGKSALVKTYLHRQSLAGRWVAVLDPKGEYAAVARSCGLLHLTLRPGGDQRLNPLDPPAGANPAETARHRAGIVAALAATGLGRDLGPEERAAITATAAELPDRAGLAQVADRLLHPDTGLADRLAATPEQLAMSLRPLALELRGLLTGELAGILDGRTSPTGWAATRGLVVDLSALSGSRALAAVMVCVTGWLARYLHQPGEQRRIVVVDEAWALLADPAVTGWLQATGKLARALGAQLLLVTHRASDLIAQADAGTATERRAAGLLADTGIKVLHAQHPGEIEPAARLFGLTDGQAALLGRLPAHRALWLIGTGRVAVVDHLLGPTDAALVDTDQRMRP